MTHKRSAFPSKDGHASGRARYIGEPIRVDVSSISVAALAAGAAACPMRFFWREREYRVVEVLERSRQLRAHDSSERYVKSHSFRVRTEDGSIIELRCDRHIRGNPWRIFSLIEPSNVKRSSK